MRYMVVIECGATRWGAHAPDLPGCVAVGETREEALRLIREAIESYIDGLRQDSLPVPAPSSEGDFVQVEAAGPPDLRPEYDFDYSTAVRHKYYRHLSPLHVATRVARKRRA